MSDAYLAISNFMDQGGNVLYLIAALTFLMWTMIFERMWYFQAEHGNVIRHASQAWEERPERRSWSAHQIRDALISEASDKITGSLPLIQTCVMLCPLLGLLGTVTGMITVFDAMATQGGNARSMAAGVSQATIPTMSGMVASLSGVLGSTFIKRKVDFEVELFEDHLTTDH
ncbi:MAG: MotA/TolQ/ExbB proton channel family protein [Pseudomonadales bacterium]|jgi:biopolymer transport protein ExbB|nr:MotA/TolQ/ExbB proton channel family protein [Pseudomonadales bacterium]MDP6472949.1 MotA/TolQ/ExbB proton channel family protein [Pseudomonadales bacterium]MDP6826295.1 MotA/TolQ/ExbB proton channel family protein [Pseudomonadales bacterium]MDP6972789.1 MotA/TolQ/ExbB proton channel family protein [Pseudomonadales bacterium]|tara:strand:+ start:717 stop:1232 length:516 start_codon:yes stop_codon:yes gene_type:complete